MQKIRKKGRTHSAGFRKLFIRISRPLEKEAQPSDREEEGGSVGGSRRQGRDVMRNRS